jgi:energy-coupling factor transporter transmembrane protein EcfT
LSSRPHTPSEIADGRFLQPPPGRRYVRSFLFSRRIDAPLGQVHLTARTLLVFCLSAALLRTMNTERPDLLGSLVLCGVSALLFVGSGLPQRVARVQILLTIPALLSLFAAWIIFTPVPGTLWALWPIYNGTLPLGLALWQPIWLAIAVGYYWWRRSIVNALLLATIITVLSTLFLPLPGWTFTYITFLRPYALVVTDRSVMLGLAKVASYGGMFLSTMALVATSRDSELIGALLQLRVPQPVIFFLSTVSRALNLALVDYETIYQAQVARAVNARPRSFWRRVRDLAGIAVPMVAVMIRRSSEIGDALLARGYQLGRKQVNFYETSPWRPLDWFILACSLLLLFVAFGPYPNLTALILHL